MAINEPADRRQPGRNHGNRVSIPGCWMDGSPTDFMAAPFFYWMLAGIWTVVALALASVSPPVLVLLLLLLPPWLFIPPSSSNVSAGGKRRLLRRPAEPRRGAAGRTCTLAVHQRRRRVTRSHTCRLCRKWMKSLGAARCRRMNEFRLVFSSFALIQLLNGFHLFFTPL